MVYGSVTSAAFYLLRHKETQIQEPETEAILRWEEPRGLSGGVWTSSVKDEDILGTNLPHPSFRN